MEVLAHLLERLSHRALIANMLVAAALVAAALTAFWLVRRLLRSCHGRLCQWVDSHPLKAVSKEAIRHSEILLFRLTATAVVVIIAGGVAYHFAGHDVQEEVAACFGCLEWKDVLTAGLRGVGLALLLTGAWVVVQAVRRIRPLVEHMACAWLVRLENKPAVREWFGRLERFALAGGALAVAWAGARILGLPAEADWGIGLAARLTLILAGARLIPPAVHVLHDKATDLGERRLGRGRFHRYWERGRRLFPLGQRCFEAAVYVYAASLCVRELAFIASVADYGPRGVICIAIFFGCRVATELGQVLLHEAFGLYDAPGEVDQRGQTLAPLLHSVGRYVLFFGAGIVMLGVLGVDTRPILAGAGLLGLAVGLGAQSLVTDFVSGFFILFEGQFLVGDVVQIGDASGRVEAVGIRHTQIRDGQGKLYIIPNGQIKSVVNSSKGYINAVVDLKLPAHDDLDEIESAMREAGARLRRLHADDVLDDTAVQGVVDLSPAEMTVRAATKVRPGSQTAMQNEYRRLLKHVLDERRLMRPSLQAA